MRTSSGSSCAERTRLWTERCTNRGDQQAGAFCACHKSRPASGEPQPLAALSPAASLDVDIEELVELGEAKRTQPW